MLDLVLELYHLALELLRALHSLLSRLPRGHGIAGSLDGGSIGRVLNMNFGQGLVSALGSDAGGEAVPATLGA